jgi:hypothetical protein
MIKNRFLEEAMKSKIVLTLVILIFAGSITFGQSVPVSAQVLLVLKIASMDRNFDRFGDPVKIGVTSDVMLSEFQAVSHLKVKEKKFVVEKMNSLDDISKYKLVYIDANWKNNYSAAADKAGEGQTLIFAAETDYVESGGAAVAFKVVGGAAKIVLNVGNARKQGSDFPANFLKVTVVVGGL